MSHDEERDAPEGDARTARTTDEARPDDPLVLLVDDDPAFLTSIEKGLRRYGYRVVSASSGDEAVHRLGEVQEPVGLVVMDIFLPDTWGSSLAFTLQQMEPGLRVVYVSGYAKSDPLLASIDDPDVVLLPKPFDLEDLTTAVRNALDEWERPAG